MGVTDVPVSLRDTALLHHFRGLKPTATIRDHSVVETPCVCLQRGPDDLAIIRAGLWHP